MCLDNFPMPHCKFQSMNIIQNYHNSHTKFKFGMTIVGVLCDPHTLEFAVLMHTNIYTQKHTCIHKPLQPLHMYYILHIHAHKSMHTCTHHSWYYSHIIHTCSITHTHEHTHKCSHVHYDTHIHTITHIFMHNIRI